ncbi:MAG TPA: TetR/AcrR family transcriptional regulator [Thermomicrobiales bacterium]
MTTRERILDAALALFNEGGTAAASTNHIAAACGISPGNLYYHFRNKEEIIRALFERMFARWGEPSPAPDDRPLTVADLWGVGQDTFALLWDYRFVYRELIALLRRDDYLQQRWVEVRERGFVGFRELIDHYVAAGVLRRPDDPEEVTRLAELCWLVSEFWPASVETAGLTVDAAQMDRGVALLMQIVQPYIIADPA